MASFGEALRRERELRGVTLREIADATKISVRFLQALEADRVEVLPGGLFRRTFVRQYAKHVGLDPERMVAEFLYAHGDDLPSDAGAARKRFNLPPGSLTALGVVAVLAWLAYPRGAGSFRTESAGRDTRDSPSAPALVPPEHVYPPAAPVRVIAGSQATAETPADTAATGDLTLSITAQQDSWVQVTVDGASVLNRVLAAGETRTLAGEGEIVLSVGNAGGVSFRVNDRPGVPLGRSGEVKKNIVITRQSLPTLVEQDPPQDAPPSG